MASHTLVKRHGSPVHREAADKFALAALGVLLAYALVALVAARVRAAKPLRDFLGSPIAQTLAWVGLLFFGLFVDLQNGLVQNARRCGELSIASAALAAFLALKPQLLPQTHQVALVGAHKWVARTSVALAYFHGIVYLCTLPLHKPEVKEGEIHLETRHVQAVLTKLNLLGVAALALLTVVFVVSLGPLRRRAYFLFYALHWPLATAFFVLMIWHARPSSQILVFCGLAFIGYNFLFRVLFSRSVQFTRVQAFGALKLVTFDPPVSARFMKSDGAHVRVSPPLLRPLTWFRSSHPYTLVNDHQLLARERRFKLREDRYSLAGPFSSSFDLQTANVLLVVGGAGVSMLPSLAAYPGKRIWVTRDAAEVRALPAIGVDECDVYVTGGAVAEDEFELQTFHIDDEQSAAGDEADVDALLAPTVGDGIRRFRGRPDLEKAAAGMSDFTVVCCGPGSLITAAHLFAYKHRLPFWSEEFGF